MKCPYCAADYAHGEVRCSYCRSVLPQPAQAFQAPHVNQAPPVPPMQYAPQASRPVQIINYNFVPSMTAQAPSSPYYDHQQLVQPMVSRNGMASTRNKGMLLLLCMFGGYLGIHHFYAGRVGKGILYLLTGGLFTIGWMIDLLTIIFGTFRDGDGLPIKW